MSSPSGIVFPIPDTPVSPPSNDAAETSPTPPPPAQQSSRSSDQRWLLAGAALCFATGLALALIRGCDSAMVALAVGGGVSVIGGMSGIARGSGMNQPNDQK